MHYGLVLLNDNSFVEYDLSSENGCIVPGQYIARMMCFESARG